MPLHVLVAAWLLLASSTLMAAPPAYLTVDRSSAAVMDNATAQSVWREKMPAKRVQRLSKLFPVGRYGFISQVEGGFTEAKVCVVTARVMLVPRSGKALLFDPKKTATTFDSAPNATQAQCQDLAKAKLAEAIAAVDSSLAAN
jgi:hypothetical protein